MEETFSPNQDRNARASERRLLEGPFLNGHPRKNGFLETELLAKRFPEWVQFEKLIGELSTLGQVEVVGWSKGKNLELPLISVSFGSNDPTAPVLALFAGVHGLERIGSQVLLSLLQSFIETLLWDEVLQETLKKVRVVFMPFINPVGILNKTRANPNGVDLMRNSPIVAEEKPSWLIGGQMVSSKLPWFRGKSGIEAEAQAVIELCRRNFFKSKAVITMDFHSGFGLQDQLWFPYAKSVRPFPHLAEFFAFSESYEKTHPHHFYKIEPQAVNYTTHGDLWDYVYQEYAKENPGVYLPLALEMGSWIWLKKNPLQIFSSLGAFNPLQPHRQKRVLRRHQNLFEFLIRATASNKHWAVMNDEQKNKFKLRALERWYPNV